MVQKNNEIPLFSIYNAQGVLHRDVLLQYYTHGPNPTRIVDRNFLILDQNQAMNRLTEYFFSSRDNKRCYEVIRTLELCDTEQCPLQQIMAGAESVEIHCRRETWQGRTFSGRVLAMPLRDEQGVVIGMIEITVDENDVMALSRELRKKNDVLRKSKRLLTAHAEVARALNRESDLELLAAVSLELLCRHTPAVLGVVYLVDREEEAFLPLASHALDRKPEKLLLDQGLPGQLVVDGRDRFIDFVPPGYFHYASGSGEAEPQFLACLAVHAGTKLLAVVELGAFESLEPLKPFLANVTDELGLALEKGLALKQSEELAAKLEQKRKGLEAQNDELQAQSEELIAQSEEIQSQAEEIEAQRDDLELKTAEAEEANRMKSVFLANMSHELRTPLNALLGLTVLLKDRKAGPLTDSQEKYLEVIYRNGSILLQQLDDILDLSRIEAGQEVVTYDEIHLKGFLKTLTISIEQLTQEKGLDLILDVDPELDTMVSDERKLQQVLVNLLANAIKFTSDGEIRLSARQVEEDGHCRIVFCVSDTGIGMPEGAEKVIFDPFRQMDGSNTRKYGGSGLGLAICKRIVDYLGGLITVSSEEGKGSSFTVTLPRDRRANRLPSDAEWQQRLRRDVLNAINENDREDHTAGGESRLERGERQPFILVVDDDVEAVRQLGIVLRDAGYTVQAAFNGQTGLEMMKSRIPDLVILEPEMVVMNGLAMLREMKQYPDLARLPVLILSRDEQSSSLSAFSDNIRSILRKGDINSSTLLSLVERLITGRPHSFSVGDRPNPVPARVIPVPGGKRVLIAEDNEDNLYLVQQVIQPAGYTCICAASGQEAVVLAREEHPDLVLMDIQMPDMSGLEAASRIRELPRGSVIPIIALTARVMKGEREKALAAGCDDFLGKPVDPAILLATLERWLPSEEEENG